MPYSWLPPHEFSKLPNISQKIFKLLNNTPNSEISQKYQFSSKTRLVPKYEPKVMSMKFLINLPIM